MGGWVSHLAALEAWLEVAGELPLNVKLVIEGEEEIGSPNLERYMDAYPEAFEADVMVLTDCENPAPDIPGLTISLRGLLEDACRKGGSTFFASGMEPGWASFSLPYTLLSVAGEVTSYREEQHALDMAEAYPIQEVVFGSMGFGQPHGTVPPRFVDGVCATAWIPNLHVIADALGARLETTRFLWETHPTPHASPHRRNSHVRWPCTSPDSRAGASFCPIRRRRTR